MSSWQDPTDFAAPRLSIEHLGPWPSQKESLSVPWDTLDVDRYGGFGVVVGMVSGSSDSGACLQVTLFRETATGWQHLGGGTSSEWKSRDEARWPLDISRQHGLFPSPGSLVGTATVIVCSREVASVLVVQRERERRADVRGGPGMVAVLCPTQDDVPMVTAYGVRDNPLGTVDPERFRPWAAGSFSAWRTPIWRPT